MDTKEERKAFRKRVKDLTQKELFQWSFLTALAQRIDSELACYQALFQESETPGQETFDADAQLAGIGLMLQQEMAHRRAAQPTVQNMEGEEPHANQAQNGN